VLEHRRLEATRIVQRGSTAGEVGPFFDTRIAAGPGVAGC